MIKYSTSLCFLNLFYHFLTGYSPRYCMLCRNVNDFVLRMNFFYVALQPNANYGLLIHEVFEITHTKRHSR
jgi:hypothetical protein